MYRAEVVAASITTWGQKVITLECEYPRIIHAEARTHRILSLSLDQWAEIDIGLNTDRDLSRNASSSRAIPTERMLKKVREEPAMPAHWGKNQRGMQADEEHNAGVMVPSSLRELFIEFCQENNPEGEHGFISASAEVFWRFNAWLAAMSSQAYSDAGYHKQVANRLTEPYQWMITLITATDLDNYFELRDHLDADPTFQRIAKLQRAAVENATYKLLNEGEWHLPYILQAEEELPLHTKQQLSTARCARVSYTPFDGDPSHEKEKQRHDLLVGSKPWHASPTEHLCTPKRGRWGNFTDWLQYRQVIEGKCDPTS